MKNIVVFLISSIIGVIVYAQTPGSLDLTFGGTGIVVTPIGNYNDRASSIAIQDDGKLVVAGFTASQYGSPELLDFAIVRYNTDGTLDNTFGTNGKVVTSIGNVLDMIQDVAIQSDGKIVVAGFTESQDGSSYNYDFVVARYKTNGTLDDTFGTDGIVITNFGGYSGATGIVIQSNGNIVVCGGATSTTDNCFAVARYNANGTLDNTFGNAGKVITPMGTGASAANAVSIQNDGKIVLTGISTNYPNYYDFAVVRYNTSGTLDNTFGTNGIVITTIGNSNDWAYDLAFQTDGKIVVTGYTFDGIGTTRFVVVRYNSTGSLDNTFGSNGIVLTSIGLSGNCSAYALAIQIDGKIVVAGTSLYLNGLHYYNEFAIARYNTNGTLDDTFGTGGIVLTSIGLEHAESFGVAIQTDGKVVVAGYASNNSNYDFTVVRYIGDNTTSLISVEKNTPIQVKNIFPNPAKDKCTIYIEGKEKSIITIDLYNSFGIKVRSVLNERKTLGDYSTTLDISDFEAGVYYFKIKAFIFEDNSTFSVVKKIIVLR